MKSNVMPVLRFVGLMSWLICCAWTATTTSANSAEPIKIGAVLPFSGGVELYGRQAKLGLDLAAKEINAAGGILGGPWRWSTRTTRPIRWPPSMRRAS
jgi:hypothetical protein